MVNEVAVLCADESGIFSRGEVKRSSSESDFDIEEFLSKAIVVPEENDYKECNSVVASEFNGLTDECFQEADVLFCDDCSAAPLNNRERETVLMRCERFSEVNRSQNLTPKHSSITGTINSQSSERGQSNQGANSRSSHEQSDDEDVEIELGQCEQSGDPVNLKRMRRKISNQNSAKRSRQRKQARMTELECQAANLQEENASLFRHLTDASQQYRDANVNNRVLKSGLEALRAKVRLAEDVIARGSLTHTLNQLLQNHISKMTEPMDHVRTLSNVSPTIDMHGDGVSHTGTMTSGHRSGPETTNVIENLTGSVGSDDWSDFWG